MDMADLKEPQGADALAHGIMLSLPACAMPEWKVFMAPPGGHAMHLL